MLADWKESKYKTKWKHDQYYFQHRFNMPYKSEKIKIQGAKYDRRVKLTDEDREHIREIRETEGLSYQKIADKFGVSKRLIIFICKPETLERNKELREQRGGSDQYYDREINSTNVRETRRYKQKSYLKGKIK